MVDNGNPNLFLFFLVLVAGVGVCMYTHTWWGFVPIGIAIGVMFRF